MNEKIIIIIVLVLTSFRASNIGDDIDDVLSTDI